MSDLGPNKVRAPLVIAQLKRQLRVILETIEGVENRCTATDGPVSKTCGEITDTEIQRIYRAAKKGLKL